MTAEDAIARSVSGKETVHFAFDRELAEELLLSADDHVINDRVMEFGGEDEADAWRVHLDLATQTDVRGAAAAVLGI